MSKKHYGCLEQINNPHIVASNNFFINRFNQKILGRSPNAHHSLRNVLRANGLAERDCRVAGQENERARPAQYDQTCYIDVFAIVSDNQCYHSI